jgi:hypothetical protein
VQGWIDTTYMNPEGTFRLARGNKGTLFVLKKDVPLKRQLLNAIDEQNDEEVSWQALFSVQSSRILLHYHC